MSNTNDDNGGLYFIVGALVVAVAVMGFFLLGDTSNDDNPIAVIERNVDETADSAQESTSNIDLNFDDDGVSGSVSSEEN